MKSAELKNVIFHLVDLKNAMSEHQEVFENTVDLLLEKNKKQFKKNVIQIAENFNKLLKSEIKQKHKATITITIESLLMDTNQYKGFNYNYWLQQGYDEWMLSDGPEGDDKNNFIYGFEGNSNVGNDEFVDDIEGEFSRHYYLTDLDKDAQDWKKQHPKYV